MWCQALACTSEQHYNATPVADWHTLIGVLVCKWGCLYMDTPLVYGHTAYIWAHPRQWHASFLDFLCCAFCPFHSSSFSYLVHQRVYPFHRLLPKPSFSLETIQDQLSQNLLTRSMNLGNPQKLSMSEHVIINFCNKNVVIVRFRDKNDGFILSI